MFACFALSIAKDCGQLAIPTNGSANGRKTTYPNEVTFHCDDGFNIFGSRIRKCLSNGIWSGNETFCSGNALLCVHETSLILIFVFCCVLLSKVTY